MGVLTRTGATQLSGRRGKYSESAVEGYIESGKGGNGPGLDPDPGIHSISSNSLNRLKIPPTNPISETRSSESVRSTASILAVIREHSPGLRHIYNTSLKIEPGLKGKVSLRFTIAPSGQVLEAVKSMGNDVVTVPFNFSE